MSGGHKIRREAARLLWRILREQDSLASLGSLASLSASPPGTSEADDALLRELCYGSCRYYHQLGGLLEQLLDKPLKPKDGDLHCLLVIGLYQLFYLRVPDHAAINETVAAVDARKRWGRGLVNGVLREARRRWPEGPADAVAEDEVLRLSHPRWLLRRLQADWPAQWEHIARGNNERAPLTLRVNLARGSREAYLARLKLAGIEAEPGAFTETAVVLARPMPVAQLPGFAEGALSVQDESSQLAPGLLDLAAGQRVLDACAAPGGKSCAMLEQAPGIELTALDNDAARLVRVRENLDRLGLQAHLLEADAAAPATWGEAAETPFDRILLDVPCSGSGVIRRHPDIKLLLKEPRIQDLLSRQAAILDAVWPRLQSGGLLLYSTCSVLPVENREQIAAFLSRTEDARELPLPDNWGLAQAPGRQLLPGQGHWDGFYFALLQKC